MKLNPLFIVLALFTSTAFADFNVGDHVLTPPLSRRWGTGPSFSVGMITAVENNGYVEVQEITHPSKYGLVVWGQDAEGNVVRSFGKHRFLESQLVAETSSVVWNKNGKLIKQGSQVTAPFGRNPNKQSRVLYTFKNGYAALVDEATYWDWVGSNRNENNSARNDDHLFEIRPAAVYVR